jgi:hypothetical protein
VDEGSEKAHHITLAVLDCRTSIPEWRCSVAQQELESSAAEMARAAAILFHEGRMPVSVTVCYSDGSAWQPGLGCELLGQGEWEPVLARTLHSALDRALQGQRQLVAHG